MYNKKVLIGMRNGKFELEDTNKTLTELDYLVENSVSMMEKFYYLNIMKIKFAQLLSWVD